MIFFSFIFSHSLLFSLFFFFFLFFSFLALALAFLCLALWSICYPCLSRSLLSHKHLSTQKQTQHLSTPTHTHSFEHTKHHEPRAPNFHNTNSKETTHQLTRETHTYEHEHKHHHTETNTKQTRPTTTPMPKNPNTNHDQTHTDSGHL